MILSELIYLHQKSVKAKVYFICGFICLNHHTFESKGLGSEKHQIILTKFKVIDYYYRNLISSNSTQLDQKISIDGDRNNDKRIVIKLWHFEQKYV